MLLQVLESIHPVHLKHLVYPLLAIVSSRRLQPPHELQLLLEHACVSDSPISGLPLRVTFPQHLKHLLVRLALGLQRALSDSGLVLVLLDEQDLINFGLLSTFLLPGVVVVEFEVIHVQLVFDFLQQSLAVSLLLRLLQAHAVVFFALEFLRWGIDALAWVA